MTAPSVSSVGRLLILALTVASLTACASGAPASGVRSPEDIAGSWRGRVAGLQGHAVTALHIRPDGAYRGTMYLDGGDREFSGRIVVLSHGVVRYGGSDGHGTVELRPDGSARTLRFLHDDGGPAATYRPFP